MLVSKTQHDKRNQLYGDVFYGRISPEAAEIKAKQLGLRPFANKPDPKLFDPMQKPTWSLGMVVAWIAWRDLDQVRLSWEDYCKDYHYWTPHDSRLAKADGVGMENVTGWELKTHTPYSLTDLIALEALGLNDQAGAKMHFTIKSARDQLWQALTNEDLVATGIPISISNIPKSIPFEEWSYLNIHGDKQLRDELRYANDILKIAYKEIILRQSDVIRLWRPLFDKNFCAEKGFYKFKTNDNSKCINHFVDKSDLNVNKYIFIGEAIEWIMSRGVVVSFQSIEEYDKSYLSSAKELFRAIDDYNLRVEGYSVDKGRVYKKLPKGIWAKMSLEPANYDDPVFSPVDEEERRDDGGTVFLGARKWCGVRLPASFVSEHWSAHEHRKNNQTTIKGRPNKQDRVLSAYRKNFPDGHGDTAWKEIANRVSEETGFSVSIDSIRRALGLKK